MPLEQAAMWCPQGDLGIREQDALDWYATG